MHGLWSFLQNRKNREILDWLGGDAVVVGGGIWMVATFFWTTDSPGGARPGNIEASNGGVVIGRDAIDSTVQGGDQLSAPGQ
jgi:hypothetical protein